MARVVYTDENYQTIYVDVNAQHPEVTIGRQQDNMLRIASKAISRHHAKIVFQNGRYILMDLGSSNGCFVNNTRVTQQEIHPGEKIRCGSIPIDFIEEPRTAAPAPAPAPAPAARPQMPQPAPGIPGANGPQRPSIPAGPAFNTSGPAFVANNPMPMNNGPLSAGPMINSSMNNSAVAPMPPGPLSGSMPSPAMNNGPLSAGPMVNSSMNNSAVAPMPPGPLSGSMPSAPGGGGLKMPMNAPKLQMFSPGLPSPSATSGGDMRNINIRPISGGGNFRPTMINQPSYDQNMERIAQQSQQQQASQQQMRPNQGGSILPPLGPNAAPMPPAPIQNAGPALSPFGVSSPETQEPEPDPAHEELHDENDAQFFDDGLESSPNNAVESNDAQNDAMFSNDIPDNPDNQDIQDIPDNPVDDHFAASGRARFATRDASLGRRAPSRTASGRMDSNLPASSPSSQHPAVSANARRPQNQRTRMPMHNGRMMPSHDEFLDDVAPADNLDLPESALPDFQDDGLSANDENRQNVLDAFEDAAKDDLRKSSSQFPAFSENDSFDDLKNKLKDAISELRSLRHQLDDAEAARMEAEADLDALRDGKASNDSSDLQAKLDETQSLLDAKIKENEKIYALLQEAEDARDAALSASNADSGSDALNEEIASLRAKCEEAENNLQKSQTDCENYKNQADQAQYDLANARSNVTDLQSQIDSLTQANNEKDTLIASLRAELEQKNNELAAANNNALDSINAELAQAKSYLGNVSAEFSSVKAELAAANEAKLELQKALDIAKSSAANPAVSASGNASADFVKTWAPKFDSVIGYAQNVVNLIDGMQGVDPSATESIHSMFDVLRLCDKKIKKAAKSLS